MVSRKIMKYVVAFQRNRGFGHALGYGEGSGPGYQMELAFDYMDSAARKAGLNHPLLDGIIYDKSISNLTQERETRRKARGIINLTPTQEARVSRIKEAHKRWLSGNNK